MKHLNKIALIIGLICIICGATVSILGIWGFIGDKGIVWRSLATLGVIFLSVILTVTINNLTESKEK